MCRIWPNFAWLNKWFSEERKRNNYVMRVCVYAKNIVIICSSPNNSKASLLAFPNKLKASLVLVAVHTGKVSSSWQGFQVIITVLCREAQAPFLFTNFWGQTEMDLNANTFSCCFNHLLSYSPHPMWMANSMYNLDHTHISWSLFPTSSSLIHWHRQWWY